MFVVLMGTGATVFYNMISNILRALGDSKTPLYFLIVSSVLNILLDILFIIPFKMGVAGAAWATILSQFLSALLSLFMGVKKFEILHLHRADFKNLKKAMIRHLKTGFPMGFQMSLMCIGIIVLRHPIVRLFLTKPSHTIYHYSDMYLTVVCAFLFYTGSACSIPHHNPEYAKRACPFYRLYNRTCNEARSHFRSFRYYRIYIRLYCKSTCMVWCMCFSDSMLLHYD